jgi:hypothetical protein
MTDTVQRAKEALWNRCRELNPDIEVDPTEYYGGDVVEN